jgi:hypothetical protein
MMMSSSDNLIIFLIQARWLTQGCVFSKRKTDVVVHLQLLIINWQRPGPVPKMAAKLL